MDIRKYLGKRTQKEQSDKSSGEESDTEESLCRADKSKTFMTCYVSNKLTAQQTKKCYTKTINYKKFGKKFILGFSVKILKLACFVVIVRNREGHLQVQKVGGGQGELLTGSMPQNYCNCLVNLNATKTHQSLKNG